MSRGGVKSAVSNDQQGGGLQVQDLAYNQHTRWWNVPPSTPPSCLLTSSDANEILRQSRRAPIGRSANLLLYLP